MDVDGRSGALCGTSEGLHKRINKESLHLSLHSPQLWYTYTMYYCTAATITGVFAMIYILVMYS